jgi:hypothetical protein
MLGTVRRELHVVALEAKRPLQRVPDRRLVVHDQQAHTLSMNVKAEKLLSGKRTAAKP